jgi:hypothetical protein
MHSKPKRCARRPLAGGLVVLWVSLDHGGHAVFGSLGAERGPHRLCVTPVPDLRPALDER